jgi:hypothetical protein
MCNKELSATDNVVRHVNTLQMDDNGDATFEAFALDVTEETGLSVSKLNSSKREKKDQLAEVRLVLGRHREMKPSHGLAELNVGKTREVVFVKSGTLPCSIRIRFIDDPIPSNPWHSTIELPVDDYPNPQDVADLIAVWIALSVIKTHPARLD